MKQYQEVVINMISAETKAKIRNILEKPLIKDFIKDNLLDNAYAAFYDSSSLSSWNLTEYLLSCGINPLDYFNYEIPRGSFSYLDYPEFKELVISNPNIKYIGGSAFEECESLEKLIFPDDSTVEEIGIAAFCYCPLLSEVYFPKTLKKIQRFAFSNCHNLGFVEFKSIETIDNTDITAFDSPDPTVFHITAPAQSLTNICRNGKAFRSVTEIKLPEKSTAVDPDAVSYSFSIFEYLEHIEFDDTTITRSDIDPEWFL